ncbi:regulator of chromosome condensation 1/beta-lactamase-inhibitor protein II [Dunaliella salina]|uniref:Regulator of chromosome condensation 1/beta-lactamase-inhibitor protein II n=1 Tax=Dunaliella salina TaxID=3046 RepID=A0ABQ7GCN2_DUNSA|nr:regulator of chromosome condensation 1/beta-lactamase-inhibitor protein II [Dunaliella salina]|eukprot:KAF5832372.1 regulator of chromosome condensation 1/beta-lactamase-inhibitor protein II [Dunaliella salina]
MRNVEKMGFSPYSMLWRLLLTLLVFVLSPHGLASVSRKRGVGIPNWRGVNMEARLSKTRGKPGLHEPPQQRRSLQSMEPPSPLSSLMEIEEINAISSRGELTCGINATRAFCWGVPRDLADLFNINGSVISMESMEEMVHEAGDAWRMLEVGPNFACGIQLYTDVLYCLGLGSLGQLGNGIKEDSAFPVCTLPDVATVSVGKNHACAIKLDGSGYCWGKGVDYQLGDGVAENSATPVLVPSRGAWLQLVAGDTVTCGVTLNGTLFCWGSSTTGLLGLGSSVSVKETPTQLGPPSARVGDEWAGVYTGFQYVCAYTLMGDCYCWGGEGDSFFSTSTPTLVFNSTVSGYIIVGVSVGSLHACALGLDSQSGVGRVLCWGDNVYGQSLPASEITVIETPTLVNKLLPYDVIAVSASNFHTCAQTQETTVCFGDGRYFGIDAGEGVVTFAEIQWALDPYPDCANPACKTCHDLPDGTETCERCVGGHFLVPQANSTAFGCEPCPDTQCSTFECGSNIQCPEGNSFYTLPECTEPQPPAPPSTSPPPSPPPPSPPPPSTPPPPSPSPPTPSPGPPPSPSPTPPCKWFLPGMGLTQKHVF